MRAGRAVIWLGDAAGAARFQELGRRLRERWGWVICMSMYWDDDGRKLDLGLFHGFGGLRGRTRGCERSSGEVCRGGRAACAV